MTGEIFANTPLSILWKMPPAVLLAKVIFNFFAYPVDEVKQKVNRAAENHRQQQWSILAWHIIHAAGHCADALTYSAELNRTRKCRVLTRQLPVPG